MWIGGTLSALALIWTLLAWPRAGGPAWGSQAAGGGKNPLATSHFLVTT